MTAPSPPWRVVGPEAVAVLEALHAAAFPPVEHWSAGAITSLMSMPGTVAILAQETGPAGFVLARATADEAEILTIAVHPDFRRRGVARGLLRALMARCAAQGVRRLFLEVSVHNAPAAALYAALGFVPVGLRRAYYPDGSDARVLAADLAP